MASRLAKPDRASSGGLRVVFAPDSFKGSVSAAAAAGALAEGWRSIRPDDQLELRPMADGGEGTLRAFESVAGSERVPVVVTGPDGDAVVTHWLRLPTPDGAPGGTAVVELAACCGIELLGERRLPWSASTRGLGEAVVAALDAGVDALIVGIGSSASTDAGLGLLSALGARFVDADGHPVGPGAAGLLELAGADLAGLRRLPPGGVIVLTDVTHPLLGPTGAAAVFGPQKGFEPGEVSLAEAALARAAAVVGLDGTAPGGGAAGGTGAALLRWGARLVPGADEVARLVGLPEAIARADVVVTGEGSFDGQSAGGKVPARVAGWAREAGVAVGLVAGAVTPDADTSTFAAVLSLTEVAGSAEAAMAEPRTHLRAAGAELARRASTCGG